MIEVRANASVRSLGRISAPKASDVLAGELRGRIRSGEWPQGLALPSERELSSQTGLSRTSVREALRMLEVDGLLQIRPGRGGGARVCRPADDELTRQLDLFIWGRNIGPDHLHELREVLEALAARGAALRRSDGDLAELVAKTEAVEANVGDPERYLDANLAWHMAVVRASHNELLTSFMKVLSNAIHRATESEAFDSPELRDATLRIHRRILAAIIEGDPEAARRRMARHVGAAQEVALAWNGTRTRRAATRATVAAKGGRKETVKAPRSSRKRARAAKEAK